MPSQTNSRTDLVIRPARLSDLEVIVSFNRDLASETEGKTLDKSVVDQGVRAVLSDATKGRYYVAERGNRVVGQLMLTLEWSDWRNGNFWWLQSVFVEKDSRGQGVFRELMRQVTREAERDPGCVGLRLYVHRHNEAALHTYQKLGFYQLDYHLYEQGGKYPHSSSPTLLNRA